MKPFRWVILPNIPKNLFVMSNRFVKHTHKKKIGTRNIGSNTQDKDIKWSWYHLNLNHLLIHKQIPLHVVFITISLTSFTSFEKKEFFFLCSFELLAFHCVPWEMHGISHSNEWNEEKMKMCDWDLRWIWRIFYRDRGVKISRFRLLVDW